jgi:chemotaxis family two-component system response regulator Rcp1
MNMLRNKLLGIQTVLDLKAAAAARALSLQELQAPEMFDVGLLPFKWKQGFGRTPMEILLIDDNPADIRMVQEGLKEALPTAHLSVAVDGVEAMRFLRREGCYSKAPRPDLIILDLRLPKKSGFEVLQDIKQDSALGNIPVVVQTSSEAPIDIQRAYSLHANCYITKPAGFEEFSRTMRVLADFWVTVAKLPNGGSQWRKN